MQNHHHGRTALKVVAITVLVIVLAVGSLFVMPTGWINKIINGKGSNLTGRELSVDGAIKFDWDWQTPTVHFNKIRMSNIEGSKDPDMVAIDELTFKIKLWKLLLLRLELPEVKIDAPKLVMEKAEDGSANWDLPAMSKGNAAANAALPTKRSNMPIIGLIQISNGTFIYRDAIKKLDLNLKVDTVQGSPGGNDNFKLSGNGLLQEQKFDIDVSGGSLKTLRDSSADYPLHLAIGMGATKIKLDGTFKDPIKMTGVNATLSLKGDNLADLFYLTTIPLPPSPPYDIEGALKKDGNIWSFDNFKGKVGDSNLAGDLSYDTSNDRGLVKANLVSTLLDIDDLSGFVGATPSVKKGETASAEQKKEAAKKAVSDKVLPDVPLDLGRLRSADMDVSLKVEKIHAPGIPLENMDVRVLLSDGVLKLDPMTLGVASGAVDGNLVLDGSKDVPAVKMDLDLKKLSLKQFFTDSRFEQFSTGHFGGKVTLSGNGKSLASVLGDSNGHITMSMSGGKISRLIIEAAGLDISEAAPLLLGKDDTTDIRCVVGDFNVNDGLLTSKAFVFDTTDSNINGTANINLKNENLDIKVEAHPKDTGISLRTPITVGGTMKHPAIGVDPKELAAKSTAATILGFIATPLASVIPFIELGLGKDSNCGGLISQAKANAAKEAVKQDQPVAQ